MINTLSAQEKFISEIYFFSGNTGEEEAIEIAGPTGTSLEGWTLLLYDGATGLVYNEHTFGANAIFPYNVTLEEQDYGTIVQYYGVDGIQDGSTNGDGVAMVNPDGLVTEFWSYDGAFLAVDGAALGQMSENIGSTESIVASNGLLSFNRRCIPLIAPICGANDVPYIAIPKGLLTLDDWVEFLEAYVRSYFYFCGTFEKETQAGDAAFFSDRFGNTYTQEEVTISNSETNRFAESQGFEGCDCTELGINTGYFDLWFEDCQLDTDVGFDDMLRGEQRRRVACQVFAELAGLLPMRVSSCTTEQTKVNVQIRPSLPVSNYFLNGDDLDDFEEGILGVGGPYIFDFEAGLPHQIITEGEVPAYIPSNSFHGAIRFNFSPNHNVIWHEELNSPTSLNYDLKSVILHEALHMLGIYGRINDEGNISLNRVSKFERFFIIKNDDDIEDGTPIFTRTDFSWTLNSDITNITHDDFFSGCQDDQNITGPDIYFLTNSGEEIPVLANRTTNNLRDGTLSHLFNDCDGNTTDEYVMHPGLFPGNRVSLSASETDILCTLGYNVGGNENCTECEVIGRDDFNPSCPPILSVPCGGTLKLNADQLLANDLPGPVKDMDILNLSPIHSYMGEIEEVPDMPREYSFTPFKSGLVLLRYFPVGCDDNVIGNQTFVYIQVIPSPDCSDICNAPIDCNESPFESCLQTENCDVLNPTCNIICNPRFCGTVQSNNNSAGGFIDLPFFDRFLANVEGWTRTHGTPNFSLVSNAITIEGGITNNIHPSEGFMTMVNLEPDVNYFTSFYYRTDAPHSFFIDLIDGTKMTFPIVFVDNSAFPTYTGRVFL